MNNWNSTANGNNPTISGKYIVTIESREIFLDDLIFGSTPRRYLTEGEYYQGDWYLEDSFVGAVSEKDSRYRVVAWQAMPEAYMGE